MPKKQPTTKRNWLDIYTDLYYAKRILEQAIDPAPENLFYKGPEAPEKMARVLELQIELNNA